MSVTNDTRKRKVEKTEVVTVVIYACDMCGISCEKCVEKGQVVLMPREWMAYSFDSLETQHLCGSCTSRFLEWKLGKGVDNEM